MTEPIPSPSDGRCPLCGGDGWSVRGNEIHCHVCGGTGKASGQLFLCGAFVTHYAEWDERGSLSINTDRRKPKSGRVTVTRHDA